MPKTVLITGCSSGTGKAAAGLFAREGWNVVATMRRPEDGTDLGNRNNVFVCPLDVEDKRSIDTAIDKGIERFGRIDALVNNAGFGAFGIFEATTPEQIGQQFRVNVFGVMDTIRAVLPHFRANKAGTIVNVSSGAGIFALPMLSLYCASKFALEGFSEALSYELASQNIIVKVVEPGGVSGTKFSDRSGEEAAAVPRLSDYDGFAAHVAKVFDGLRNAELSTTQEVARAIFTAVTDGADRLRYVQGQDIAPLVVARREHGEDKYTSMMREHFMFRSVSTTKYAPNR